MTIILPNLAIAGYRSFGKNIQRFDQFAKINFFIGQNNAGKSNVLRFLNEIYPLAANPRNNDLDALAYHLPGRTPVLLGIGETIAKSKTSLPTLPENHRLLSGIADPHNQKMVEIVIGKLLKEKARIDGSELCWTEISIPGREYAQESWDIALNILDDRELQDCWKLLTGMGGGDRKHAWEPAVKLKAQASIPSFKVKLIPAIRQIGIKGSVSDGFDGTGIIDRLAKLQNPSGSSQENKVGFKKITQFVRAVVDRPEAEIEIPYDRDTILIHMDGKVLPIESLGTGIHEVIILAAAATVLSGHVICIEEPELHLNPILQKKLIQYLSNNTENQYFISTHSAAFMDTSGAEIYHITLENGSSVATRVTSDHQKSSVCEDLGYHPSDLLQANCVIWVEGPSDRIYLNFWLKSLDPQIVEGVHYSIMFYGGRLASHLSNEDTEFCVEDFISLRRLNRRGVMIIDSDRESSHKHLNETKRRLQEEFNKGPGHAWITAGREIENYIPVSQLEAAIAAVCPLSTAVGKFGRYDNALKIKKRKGGETQASKVKIAHYVVENFSADYSLYGLNDEIMKIVKFIKQSNPLQKN